MFDKSTWIQLPRNVHGTRVVDELAKRDTTAVRGDATDRRRRELSHANVPYGVVLGDDGDMSGMLTEVDIIAVARVVEGEDDTGDSIANQDDDWVWEGIKAVADATCPLVTSNSRLNPSTLHDRRCREVNLAPHRLGAAQPMLAHVRAERAAVGDELTGIVRDVDRCEAYERRRTPHRTGEAPRLLLRFSEAYGGAAGFWTYGPQGAALKSNILENAWRDRYVFQEGLGSSPPT